MATKCNGCGEQIRDLNYMECSSCSALFDVTCLRISSKNFQLLTQEEKDTWTCPPCKKPSSPKVNISEIDTNTNALNNTYIASENVTMTRGSRKNLRNENDPIELDPNTADISALVLEIREMRKEMQELPLIRKEVSDLKNQISSMSAAMNQKFSEFETKLSIKYHEIAHLQASIFELKHIINDQEQQNLTNEMEIAGVEEHDNENLNHTILLISKKIGVDLVDSDLDFVMRVGLKRVKNPKPLPTENAMPRPIVVKLLRRSKRDEFIRAAKGRRNLTTEEITKGPATKIYVNERLTKYKRFLFRETRKRAQQYSYKYCWVRNGAIYVRKEEKMPAILIRTPVDLDQKLGSEVVLRPQAVLPLQVDTN